MMSSKPQSETHYTRERNGYMLTVRPTQDGKFTAKLENLTTGATLENGGWSSRMNAVDYVQRMYAAKLI